MFLDRVNKQKEKTTLLRRYKIGELPDIQISSKDIVDPMIHLASCDEEFSSELLGLIFEEMCIKEKSPVFAERFIASIPTLFTRSTKHSFLFVSTMQKLLTILCKETGKHLFIDMKKIAELSNSYDYSIMFTEENLIQMGKAFTDEIDLAHPEESMESTRKEKEVWLDLMELYHKTSEDDHVYAILDKALTSSNKGELTQGLRLKNIGDLKKSVEIFEKLSKSPSVDARVQEFILGEYLECQTLLGNWDGVQQSLLRKSESRELNQTESKVLATAVISTKSDCNVLSIINFEKHHLFYEEAILTLMIKHDIDKPKYLLAQHGHLFIESWNKVSAFALRSKHEIIEMLQKSFEFKEFLAVFSRIDLPMVECRRMFDLWSERHPNPIHDSHITALQILEGRLAYTHMISDRYGISEDSMTRNVTDWLVQVAALMVKKGTFGSAEYLIRKALLSKKTTDFFSWGVYKATARLRLKQLMMEANTNITANVVSSF